MLIEILGNSSSILVLLLLGLSIYFGIQSKIKKNKWLHFFLNKQEDRLWGFFKRKLFKDNLFEQLIF